MDNTTKPLPIVGGQLFNDPDAPVADGGPGGGPPDHDLHAVVNRRIDEGEI